GMVGDGNVILLQVRTFSDVPLACGSRPRPHFSASVLASLTILSSASVPHILFFVDLMVFPDVVFRAPDKVPIAFLLPHFPSPVLFGVTKRSKKELWMPVCES